MYNVKTIAKYFIFRTNKEDKSITNKKLQKLIYYAQAWNLVFYDCPLFDDEIEAWVHGPVVRDVYNKYRVFGFSKIDMVVDDDVLSEIKEKEMLLDEIWRVYGKHGADYLEALTHIEQPWIDARANCFSDSDYSAAIISHDSMKKYYKELLNSKKIAKAQ